MESAQQTLSMSADDIDCIDALPLDFDIESLFSGAQTGQELSRSGARWDLQEEVQRDMQRDRARDRERDSERDITRDITRDIARDLARDQERDLARDLARDQKRDLRRRDSVAAGWYDARRNATAAGAAGEAGVTGAAGAGAGAAATVKHGQTVSLGLFLASHGCRLIGVLDPESAIYSDPGVPPIVHRDARIALDLPASLLQTPLMGLSSQLFRGVSGERTDSGADSTSVLVN